MWNSLGKLSRPIGLGKEIEESIEILGAMGSKNNTHMKISLWDTIPCAIDIL